MSTCQGLRLSLGTTAGVWLSISPMLRPTSGLGPAASLASGSASWLALGPAVPSSRQPRHGPSEEQSPPAGRAPERGSAWRSKRSEEALGANQGSGLFPQQKRLPGLVCGFPFFSGALEAQVSKEPPTPAPPCS